MAPRAYPGQGLKMHLETVILWICLVVCQGSQFTEEKPNTENTFFTDAQKSEIEEILSKYKYDASKKDGTMALKNDISHCFNIFNENEQKGWSSPLSSTCVTPGNQCTTDYRNITVKHSHGLNNNQASSSSTGWKTRGGWNSNAWSQSSSSPPAGKTCCNEDICTNGVCCTPAPAASTHSICKTNSDCCGFLNGISQCSTTLGICLLTLGTSCNSTNQCISGTCDGTCCYPTGTCMPSNEMCTSDKQCCGNGVCQNGTCLESVNGSCCSDSDCMSPNKCIMGTCTACVSGGTACSAAAPCCPGTNSICNSVTNMCGNCQAIGGSCTSAPDTCCSGGVCTMGICVVQCVSGTTPCGANAPCCQGVNSICNSMTNVCSNCQAVGGSCTSSPDTCCVGRHCNGGMCVYDTSMRPAHYLRSVDLI